MRCSAALVPEAWLAASPAFSSLARPLQLLSCHGRAAPPSTHPAGISIVKLMGRQSGFIAMNASMASGGCLCWMVWAREGAACGRALGAGWLARRASGGPYQAPPLLPSHPRSAPPLPSCCPPLPAGVVDVCLIPEIAFDLDRLCDFVKSIMDRKDYCVVCVAEGAACGRAGGRGVGVG